MNVGERITYFRKLKGITTNRLANESGISQSFLRNVELSNNNITVDNLEAVCGALGIGLQEFFTIPTGHDQIEEELVRKVCALPDEKKIHLLEFLKY